MPGDKRSAAATFQTSRPNFFPATSAKPGGTRSCYLDRTQRPPEFTTARRRGLVYFLKCPGTNVRPPRRFKHLVQISSPPLQPSPGAHVLAISIARSAHLNLLQRDAAD